MVLIGVRVEIRNQRRRLECFVLRGAKEIVYDELSAMLLECEESFSDTDLSHEAGTSMAAREAQRFYDFEISSVSADLGVDLIDRILDN